MKCPKCQFENPESMEFLGECGTNLERICLKCNFKNPSHFKLCGEGGLNLTCEAFVSPVNGMRGPISRQGRACHG